MAAIDRGRLLVGDRVRLDRLGLHVIDLDQGRCVATGEGGEYVGSVAD